MFEYPSKGEYQYNILACYGGEPFLLLQDFYDYYSAQMFVINLINTTDGRYRYNFYVDNNFYENKYPLGFPKQRYYKIIKRKVTNYIDADCDFELQKNNILQFKKNY